MYNDKLWNQFLNPPVKLVSTWYKIALEHYYFVKKHSNFLAHTSKFRKNSFGYYHICVSFMVFVSKWHKKKSSKSRSLSKYLSIYLSLHVMYKCVGFGIYRFHFSLHWVFCEYAHRSMHIFSFLRNEPFYRSLFFFLSIDLMHFSHWRQLQDQ